MEKVKTKRSYKEEREYEALPEKIENLEQEIALLEQELTKEEIYTDHVKLTKIQREIAEKEKVLTEFYERFEELDSIG